LRLFKYKAIDMKNKSASIRQEEIVSISEASHILGVNEATLRQWTDEGELKAFITPGGHRRYSRADLKKFTRSSRKKLGIKDLAVVIEDTSGLHREIARKFLEDNPSFRQSGSADHSYLADLGRRLLELVVKYVGEPATRLETIAEARGIGTEFGLALAKMRLPLTDSVTAFLSHRDPFMKAAIHLISKHEPIRGSIMDAIPLANQFIDEALVAMIAAHQSYSNKSKGKLTS
jgi:excisionase family DNA binding protein